MSHADDSLDQCLKCSLCNGACPVYAAHAEYPGPKRLGPELERMRREGIDATTPWVDYCLGCHACDLACPNQVQVAGMIAAAKAQTPKPLMRRMRDWWFARPALIGRLATMLPAVANFALSRKIVRVMIERVMAIGSARTFPRYARRPLEDKAASGSTRPRVVFYPGCAIRYNQPELGSTVVQLLEKCGFAVDVVTAACCGLPAEANGDRIAADSAARENITFMADKIDDQTQIVTACTSCGHRLKTAFGGAANNDATLAAVAGRIARQTIDLGELLNTAQIASHSSQPLRIAYHAPCHLKAQGIGRPWLQILRQIPGVQIEELDAGCCGMSGTYGFKQEKYELSLAIGRRLFESIEQSGADVIVTECATCRMQIEHATGLRTAHPAEVLTQILCA